MPRVATLLLITAVAAAAGTANGQEVLNEKQMSIRLAHEIALGALEQCRNDGWKVAVAVVDRGGQTRVLLRDDGTGPHTTETSRRKAYTAATFRVPTLEFAARIATNPGAAGLKELPDVTTLGGGVPVRSHGEVIGAVGVSGAPGGDKDDVCAQAGLRRVLEALQ